MSQSDRVPNLSDIETRWSLVLQAHGETSDAAAAAQRQLMERYAGAVHRYLVCIAPDRHVAADLAQEFALRFLRGDFHRADPSRGRFRDYLKSSVVHLVVDAHRRLKHRPRSLTDDVERVAESDAQPVEMDQQFLDCWRDELLSRAWKRLADHERASGQPFHTVLRYRADNPDRRSSEIAETLSAPLRKKLTAVWVRQTLRRARAVFVDLLKDEVARSLGNPSDEELVEELQTLGLWEYCREKKDSRSDGD